MKSFRFFYEDFNIVKRNTAGCRDAGTTIADPGLDFTNRLETIALNELPEIRRRARLKNKKKLRRK